MSKQSKEALGALVSALGEARDLAGANRNCPGYDMSAADFIAFIDQAVQDIGERGVADLARIEELFLPTTAWDDLTVQMHYGASKAPTVAEAICQAAAHLRQQDA